MVNRKKQIDPPLYMAHTFLGCWQCKEKMPVVALVAPNMPDVEGEICVLSHIQALPLNVAEWVRSRFPSFQYKYSRAEDFHYYANTCPNCGVISNDFDLHMEFDAPFLPETIEEARQLTIEPIPLQKSIAVRANFGMGIGDLILDHARRVDSKPPPKI